VSVDSIYICATCGDSFVPTRCDARHCSQACKQKAYRSRQHERQYDDFDALKRRAEAARTLIRAGDVDPLLAFSYVIAPTPRLEQA
jgi:hypothetical protein